MKKVDNKGFSLIELIIVVTIIIVLFAVLTPQYLKYIEKSRTATDLENARMVVNALQIYSIDPDVHDTVPTHYETITVFAINDNANRDPRVDQYAERALKASGIDLKNGYKLRTQSKWTWETWSVHYMSDGKGGILFGYSQTGETPDGTPSFVEQMESVAPASFDVDDRTGNITMRPGK